VRVDAAVRQLHEQLTRERGLASALRTVAEEPRRRRVIDGQISRFAPQGDRVCAASGVGFKTTEPEGDRGRAFITGGACAA
jgi:hypothetical protein